MFKEELTTIRAAEVQADQIRLDAKSEFRSLIDQAQNNASYLIGEAELKAKETYDALVAEGLKQAQEEYDSAIHQAGIESNSIAIAARTRKDEAIKFIVERIVGLSVNS